MLYAHCISFILFSLGDNTPPNSASDGPRNGSAISSSAVNQQGDRQATQSREPADDLPAINATSGGRIKSLLQRLFPTPRYTPRNQADQPKPSMMTRALHWSPTTATERNSAQASDLLLTTRCQEAIANDRLLSKQSVSVRVERGQAIVQGIVPHDITKNKFTTLLEGVPGIKRVRNELTTEQDRHLEALASVDHRQAADARTNRATDELAAQGNQRAGLRDERLMDLPPIPAFTPSSGSYLEPMAKPASTAIASERTINPFERRDAAPSASFDRRIQDRPDRFTSGDIVVQSRDITFNRASRSDQDGRLPTGSDPYGARGMNAFRQAPLVPELPVPSMADQRETNRPPEMLALTVPTRSNRSFSPSPSDVSRNQPSQLVPLDVPNKPSATAEVASAKHPTLLERAGRPVIPKPKQSLPIESVGQVFEPRPTSNAPAVEPVPKESPAPATSQPPARRSIPKPPTNG